MALHVCVRGIGIRRSKDLRAEIGKCPNSTNERKKMSTKTLRKRIALVAVTALGAGLLSVVAVPSANAAIDGTTYKWGTAVNTAPVAGAGGACSYSAATNTLTTLSIGATTLFAKATDSDIAGTTTYYTVSQTSGVAGYFNTSAADATTSEAKVAVNNSKTVVTYGNTSAGAALDLPDSIAWVASGLGTAKFAITETTIATGATTTLATYTLNVVATCDNTYSAANSAVQLTTGTLGTGATELTTATGVSDTANADAPAWNAAAYIALWLADQYGAPVNSSSSYLTATATGGATVSWAEADTSSTQSTAVVAGSGLHNEVLAVFPNSATYDAVSTTVTVTYNGTVVGTKTINFRGDAKSIKISSVRGAITTNTANNAAGTPNLTAYRVETLDSAGNRLAVNPILYAGTGATSGAIAAITGSATASAAVGVACGATAGTGTQVLYYVRTSDGVAVISPTVALTCSSDTKHTYTVSTDKATYLPGESGTLTITVKDSGGRPVSDAAVLGTAASKFAIGGSGLTFLSAPLHTDTSDGGKFVYKFYTTLTEGNYVAGVTLSEATVVTTETANFTVKGSSAATSNADVLKAIVSLIASINKQIAALQKALLRR
jgi:hypothetical protein